MKKSGSMAGVERCELRNPDGRFCLLLRNLEAARQAEVTLNGVARKIDLPGHSLCALMLEA